MRRIGDNLTLRCAEESDIDSILEHVGTVNGFDIPPLLDQLLRQYPAFSLRDNFVVVDETDRVVSYICLLRRKYVLNGIEIPSGQMGIVGTSPDYRHLGLIRRLNEALEERVTEYGLQLLTIAGIPYFYRNFGYEFAITMWNGISIPLEAIPLLKNGEVEPVVVERVTSESFSDYLACRAQRNSFLDLYYDFGLEHKEYYTSGKLGEAATHEPYLVSHKGKPVGMFSLELFFGSLSVRELWLERAEWIPPVLRFLKSVVQRTRCPLRVDPPSKPSLISYLEQISGSRVPKPYAWYVRIPDIERFLRTIAPLLEARLANSEFCGLTDRFRLSCYREGYELVFNDGKLNDVIRLGIRDLHDMHVNVPPLVVFQLLLGYRTLGELETIYPDVVGQGLKKPILEVLFPRTKACLQPSL